MLMLFFPKHVYQDMLHVKGLESVEGEITASACLFCPPPLVTWSFCDSLSVPVFDVCLCRLSPHSVIHAAVSAPCLLRCSFSLPLCTTFVLCSPLPSCCLLSHRLRCCVSCGKLLLSFSLVFQVSLCLPALSLFFSFFSLSHCLVVCWGQRKGIVTTVSTKEVTFSFVYEEKAKDEWFFCIFTSHYFQLPMLPAVGQMNNINYKETSMRE